MNKLSRHWRQESSCLQDQLQGSGGQLQFLVRVAHIPVLKGTTPLWLSYVSHSYGRRFSYVTVMACGFLMSLTVMVCGVIYLLFEMILFLNAVRYILVDGGMGGGGGDLHQTLPIKS